MPRAKRLDIALRNREIVRRVQNGERLQTLADEYGISKPMVSKIFHAEYDTITDDATRDMLRAGLEESWYSLTQYEREINQHGGRRVVAANGKPVFELIENPDDPAHPLVDYSRPVYDKTDLTKVADSKVKVARQMALLYGLERLQQRQEENTAEITQVMEWVEQLVAENKTVKEERDILRAQTEFRAQTDSRLAQLESAEHSHGYESAEEAEVVSSE